MADKGKSPRTRLRTWLRRLAKVLLLLAAIPVVLTFVYAVIPPPVSNLMLFRAISGHGITKTWVKLSDISPNLPRAVITAEDARFCSHHGVDWVEFQEVIEDALEEGESPARGASTISMQAAKNLFLWEGRDPIRKILELPVAMWMDLLWTKERMMEVYLNIVEWAPGIYGAEAASQFHFKKPAAKLSRREAALLAAVLPNPLKRKAGKPSRGVRRIADRIQIRMQTMGPYLTCLSR